MSTKPVRIADVAKEAGVGAGTVSRVLNDDPHVSAQTRAAVEQAMRKMQYKPNTFARSLKSKRSQSMGVFVADINNSFFSKIIRAIEETLQESSFSLLLFDTGMQEKKVTQCIDTLEEKMLDGLFILGEHLNNEQYQRLVDLNIPVVVITMQVPIFGHGLPKNFASITINNERAAYSAIDFLCKQGYQHIALLMSAMDDENVGHARYVGYCNALSHNKLDLEPSLVCSNDYLSLQSGYDSIKSLVEKGTKFDAVFAVSDFVALGALRALCECGLRVPQDVVLVGFDGIEQGQFSIPSLTTIDQPRYLMGQVGANIMLDMVQKKELINRETILNYTFVERESTRK